MLLAIFGIENDNVNLAVNLFILFLIVVYIATVVYTFLDARRRLDDPVLVACATVASLAPFVGVAIYSILRPPEFLEDRRERELEIRAAELRVRQLEENSCPSCEHPIERMYLRCPNCRTRVKDPCRACSKPVDPRWSICPYCETPTRASSSRPRGAEAEERSSRPSGAPSSSSSSKRRQPSPAERVTRSSEPAGGSERPPAPSRSKKRPASSSSQGSGSGSRPSSSSKRSSSGEASRTGAAPSSGSRRAPGRSRSAGDAGEGDSKSS